VEPLFSLDALTFRDGLVRFLAASETLSGGGPLDSDSVHFGPGIFGGIDVFVHPRFQFGGLRLVVIRTSFLFFIFFAFFASVRRSLALGIRVRLLCKRRRRRRRVIIVLSWLFGSALDNR